MQLPKSVVPGLDFGADRGAVAIDARREAEIARRHRAIFHRRLHFVEGTDIGMRATPEKAGGRTMRVALDVLKIADRHRRNVIVGAWPDPSRGRLPRGFARCFAVDDGTMLAIRIAGRGFR